MTRITPVLNANLAHTFSRNTGKTSQSDSQKETASTESTRRHYGNRRMGDRRLGERRSGGRRADDHIHRQEASVWYSSQMGAHLIGQWLERAAPPSKIVARTYARKTAPFSKRGDIA